MAPYRYDIRSHTLSHSLSLPSLSLSVCNKTIKSEDGKRRIGKCNTGVARCVCVRERETEKERGREGEIERGREEGEREREKESEREMTPGRSERR